MPHLKQIRHPGSPRGKTLDSSVTSTNNSNWSKKENLKPEKKSNSESTNQEPGSGEGGFDKLVDEWDEFISVPANNTIDSNNTRGGIQESWCGAHPGNITANIGLILTKGEKELPDGIQDLIAWHQENNHSTFVSASSMSSASTPTVNGLNGSNGNCDLGKALTAHPVFTATMASLSLIGFLALGSLGYQGAKKLYSWGMKMVVNSDPHVSHPQAGGTAGDMAMQLMRKNPSKDTALYNLASQDEEPEGVTKKTQDYAVAFQRAAPAGARYIDSLNNQSVDDTPLSGGLHLQTHDTHDSVA